MKQVAKIKVDENGTEAAAVTIIGMKDNAMPSEPIKFHANRPFLYIISEQSTGVIFFIGQYTGPEGASQIGGHSTFIQKPMTDKASVGETYDLQGRKTQSESLKKGVYIVDGKKVVVK